MHNKKKWISSSKLLEILVRSMDKKSVYFFLSFRWNEGECFLKTLVDPGFKINFFTLYYYN